MKTFIPRHIEGWLFNMQISIWPLSISMIQMFVLAWGLWLSLALFNALNSAWAWKFLAWVLVLPVFIMFVIVAFFKISELPLIPFIAKLIRTNFLDEPTKYQVNYNKVDPLDVKVKMLKKAEKKNIIEQKKKNIDKEKLEKLKWLE